MARVRRVTSRVEPIHWKGQPALAPSEQIGAFELPPLTGQPTNLYGQRQRRNGVGDIAGLGQNLMIGMGAVPPQRTQILTQNIGTQRATHTAHGFQLSRLKVAQMKDSIRRQAIRQTGAGLLPFVTQTMDAGGSQYG